MDIGDISKVASRKRLNVDAEKLREKVTRETAKIIKLKVAQDTAYWDLKEKLHQVEGNHERLQQNMVEVQMQHEAISGQYQDELRLRPETLNKMSCTREICDVLEEYSERLKDTLSRCKSDQATLCEAYQTSGQLVKDMKIKQVQGEERYKQAVERLQENINIKSEYQNQVLQMYMSTLQKADTELTDTKTSLSTALAQKTELLTALADLGRASADAQVQLHAKDESITSLQKEFNHLLQEYQTQTAEMQKSLQKNETKLKETLESNEALQRALTNQEDFTKSMSEQNNQLHERISALEEEQATALLSLKDLDAKLQASVASNGKLTDELQILSAKQIETETALKDKDELLACANTEIQGLQQNLSTLETEKSEIETALASMKEESAAKTVQINTMEAIDCEMKKKIASLEQELGDQKETATQAIKELTEAIQVKDKELDDKASAIAQLMTDVKGATDARAKLEVTLQRLRKEMDAERDDALEKERKLTKQVEQLNLVVRDKEDELSKQMSIILEIRQEKEKLQEKIQSMQNTIDNIQKELSAPLTAVSCRVPPEQDDNALMFAPEKQNPGMGSPKLPSVFAKPRTEPKQLDSMLFSIFSDSSMDGDTIDPSEVNRRFEALSRGERVAPLPLGALKRRAGVPAAHAGLKHRAGGEGHISLSQVKNDMKNKEKTFFKNKRIEAKSKRAK